MTFKKGQQQGVRFSKGHSPWNKGKGGQDDERIKKKKMFSNDEEENISRLYGKSSIIGLSRDFRCSPSTIFNILKRRGVKILGSKHFQKGKISPMKGRKHTERANEKNRLAHCSSQYLKKARTDNLHEKNPFYGGHHTAEAKQKIGEASLQRWADKEFRKKMEPHLEKSRELFKETRKRIILPKKDSKIEKRVQNFLKTLGIKFYTHQYIKDIKYGYQCDILIPKQEGFNQTTIIECDGDYWHGNLEVFTKERLGIKRMVHRCLDYERTNQMEEQGYKVIRLWENNINQMMPEDLEVVIK